MLTSSQGELRLLALITLKPASLLFSQIALGTSNGVLDTSLSGLKATQAALEYLTASD